MSKQKWTAKDMQDVSGKVVVITGANSGLGFEAGKEFAGKGAKVVLACRNMEKAGIALRQIKESITNPDIEAMQLDLANQESIGNFSTRFKEKYDRLDVLINNAGIMMVPYGTTDDGFEKQFGTNHLGHFALTGHLIDLIRSTPGARVVNISSGAHNLGKMDFSNLQFEKGIGYSPMRSYARSKLANLLFTYELQSRFEDKGIDAIAVAAHPGGANTNLGSHLNNSLMGKMMKPLMSRMMQSAYMGALPTLRAAAEREVSGGEYYGPGGFMENTGYPIKVNSSKRSHNKAEQQKLWHVSEKLTGISYL